MDELFSAYFDLSTTAQSDPEQAGPILRRILALQPELQPELRRKLLSHLLATLSTLPSDPSNSPAQIQLLSTSLSLVKFLGRSAAGSEALAQHDGLCILLQHGGLARSNEFAPLEENDDECESNDDRTVEAGSDPLTSYESEALRCLCNTLTLHPESRDVFSVVLSENTKWIDGIVRLLEMQGAGFLAGRLLFLLTSKASNLVIKLGGEGAVVKSIAAYSNRYIAALQSSNGASLTSGPAPTSADILQEHLKTAYNLMLQYGRHLPPPSDAPTPSPAVNDSLSPPIPFSNPTSPSPSSSAVRSPTTDSTRGSPMEPDGRSDDAGGAPDETAGESIGLGLGENWNSASTSSLPASKPKRRFWESKSSTEKKSADSSKKSSEISSRKTMESTSSPRSKSPGLFGRLIGGGSSKSTTPPVPQLPTFVSDPSSDGPLEGTLTLVAAQRFLPLFPNVLALAVLLPLGTDAKSPSRLLRHAADTLLNFPIALEELDGYTTSWLQPVNGATVVYSSLAPLPSRLLDLLTRTCDAYFPNDAPPGAAGNGLPHPDEVLTGGAGEVAKAEEVLGPIVLLLRKLSLLAEPAGGLKDIILPYNIDRTIPLEQRTDLIGHLLRLLSSIFLPNTAHGVGEFLFNLCNRDPVLFCTEIGYGNASGFLQNIGQLIPPPQMPSTRTNRQQASSSSSGTNRFTEMGTNGSPRVGSPKLVERLVNPITGAYEQPSSSPSVEMTSEEKALEAERLYTLFDRMAKTGVMDVENPVNRARSEGKFVETSDEAEEEFRRLNEQEEKDEKEAEEEMRRWKDRGKQGMT